MAKIKRTYDMILFYSLGYILVSFFALACLIPFILIISGSFTAEEAIIRYGYNIIPKEFSLKAYKFLVESPDAILRAYWVSVARTFVGTLISLFLMSMTAYVLQRKDFPYRNKFALFFYFTTLFSGGLVPTYILMIKYLHLKDTFLALIIPLLFSVFDMIIIRTFMSTLPESMSESAKIDGAGDFKIFIAIILPLSKPALATIGLFSALSYWNDWMYAMLYIQNDRMYPLQYYLYKILSQIEAVKNLARAGVNATIDLPEESYKLAMTVVATGPIVFLYPYLQKYFIKGITVGAVKG